MSQNVLVVTRAALGTTQEAHNAYSHVQTVLWPSQKDYNKPGKRYNFRIAAFNGAGLSNFIYYDIKLYEVFPRKMKCRGGELLEIILVGAGTIAANVHDYIGHTDENEEISAATNGKVWNGYHISVGNPHAVVFVTDISEVGALAEAPVVRPKDAYPEGVNVEFVEITGEREVKMRVFERGSGETKSCGTGVCAVALAATLHTNAKLPAKWIVNPPGGRLEVDIDGHSNATLIGPAVLIADHDISKYLL
jgi:diaminopimelate epimerase